jgi:hypothetical protein
MKFLKKLDIDFLMYLLPKDQALDGSENLWLLGDLAYDFCSKNNT